MISYVHNKTKLLSFSDGFVCPSQLSTGATPVRINSVGAGSQAALLVPQSVPFPPRCGLPSLLPGPPYISLCWFPVPHFLNPSTETCQETWATYKRPTLPILGPSPPGWGLLDGFSHGLSPRPALAQLPECKKLQWLSLSPSCLPSTLTFRLLVLALAPKPAF